MGQKRVALVTGAGRRRVGNVVAQQLAAAGYSIALNYFQSREPAEATVRELTAAGVEASAHRADVAVETDVRQLVAEVHARYGRIDALVCTAAIWPQKTLWETTADDVRQNFDVNVLGTFLCCQHAGRVMVAQPEGGAIVTIGDWAVRRPYRDYAAYFTAKGAIATLTRTFAVELAALNPRVRVNCIEPGPVMLPDDMPDAQRRRVIEATLVKREGRPENVAHAVQFLLENDFVTGVSLPVDGGRSIYSPWDEATGTS
jgi:pteridine reductase